MYEQQHTQTVAAGLEHPKTFAIPPALTTKEAAHYTGLAEPTLASLRCRGGGPPFVKYSRKAVRYLISDLDAFIADRRILNTSMHVSRFSVCALRTGER